MRTIWISTNQKITALCVKHLEEKFNTENPLLKRLYLTLCSLAKTPRAASESDVLKTERKTAAEKNCKRRKI